MRILSLVAVSFALTTGVYGQTSQSSSKLPDEAGTRAWTIVPSLTVQETITDNVALSATGKTSDQITEIRPGLRVDAKTARLKLSLNYQLSEFIYAQRPQSSQTLNSLNAFATIEAIEKLFYVDISGVVAQQSISPFGPQSPGTYSINPNATETSDFRVSPYFKGRLAGYAAYEARYSYSALRAKSAELSDLDLREWLGRVSGDTPYSFLGWSAVAERNNYDYRQARKTESDKLRGFLVFTVDPQFRPDVSVGRESNDFLTLSKQSWHTYGYGANWDPTSRTQVSAFREKRFFGYGHHLTIAHRLPLSAVKYSDVRDVTALPNQFGSGGIGNIYDLLFAQLASSIPDEAARAAYVNNLLSSAGIASNTQVAGGFLTSQVSVQRRQELSYLVRGARNMVSVAAIRDQNDQLGTGVGTSDPFSLAASIKQQGWSAGWSHQITGTSSLNVSGSRTHAIGVTSALNPALTQKMLSTTLLAKLSAKSDGAVTVRRTVVDSTSSPYTENAVVGSVSIRF
jgi:uncharacterized protein (PEP-CTERM system associated)